MLMLTAKENAKLKARVAKLEQKQLQNEEEKNNHIAKLDDDTIEVNQSSINATSIKTENSNNTPISDQSNSSCEIKTITNGNDQNLELTKTVNIDSAELYSSDSSDELSLEKTIEGSTQRLAYWFEKAIKSDYENSKTVINGNDQNHATEISNPVHDHTPGNDQDLKLLEVEVNISTEDIEDEDDKKVSSNDDNSDDNSNDEVSFNSNEDDEENGEIPDFEKE
ncbi:30069_t:CDS:2 [Gigaspora margarita]|uniref:30069_t:CDS:1 n=1 Tax=Gigaspora margarita TaxID=4874 RepID=A0ABN7UL70_GIGMA|nr:30069_t:CDS:2 [Gigaspora margarita]